MNVIPTCLTLWLLLSVASARAAVVVKVLGDGEAAFTVKSSSAPSLRDAKTYDAVVVGGGLAGLSAALYLSDHGKSVLLLEKSSVLGGLAAGGTNGSGISFNRGAAYWTNAYEEEQKILAWTARGRRCSGGRTRSGAGAAACRGRRSAGGRAASRRAGGGLRIPGCRASG